MAIDWLLKDYNNIPDPGSQGVAPIKVTSAHAWDMGLGPGQYRLSIKSQTGTPVSYFAIGTIDAPHQLAPMTPQRRFGELFHDWPGFRQTTTPVGGNVLILPHSVQFTLTSEQVVRLESWSHGSHGINTSPLPAGLPNWREFGVRIKQYAKAPGDPNISEITRDDSTTDFGEDFPNYSLRTETDQSYLFGANNSDQSTYDNLVVELVMLS